MKKTLLLWILSLALGTYALEGMAQQTSPDKKIRIILKDGEGEEEVYEYNSIEEMRADPRLQGKDLPMFPHVMHVGELADGEHQALFLRADSLRLQAESLQRDFVLKFSEGDSLPVGHQIFMRRENHELSKQLREQMQKDIPGVHFRELDVIRHRPLQMEALPEEAQKLLKEHGISLKEGEQIVILRTLDSLPLPPPPVAPQAPAAPDAEPADWISELQVYPNPADQELRIRFKSNAAGPAVLRLLDMNGKAVYTEEIPDAALLQDKTIKLPANKKGVFLLQLEQGNEKYTKRVMIK